MFEYLLVVAGTFIYLRAFHFRPEQTDCSEKGTQTEPWFASQIIDLMDVSGSEASETELGCSVELVDWFTTADSDSDSKSSTIELPPLVRQTSHGLKERRPRTK